MHVAIIVPRASRVYAVGEEEGFAIYFFFFFFLLCEVSSWVEDRVISMVEIVSLREL